MPTVHAALTDTRRTHERDQRPGGYSTSTFVRFGVPVFVASVAAACLVGYVPPR